MENKVAVVLPCSPRRRRRLARRPGRTRRRAGHDATGSTTAVTVTVEGMRFVPDAVEPSDAALAPADTSATVHERTLTVTEQAMHVGGGVTQRRMTSSGRVPGPVLRGKVGDTFLITLVNDGSMSHSIDFHVGVVPPDEVMRSIDPGDSLVYEFTAQRSGI
ncbi:nitrite reductase (NO-forming) [Actinomyces ruminicola]|uniref:Nitrite reductase (NO-forming) n=1 Tax=Actinomyces ruminicola TaxID=332524 RepID=A0A1H0DMD4_9ACTO|nr:multicopper oxidase domain-containing protein [Actinomyces ruminicola]SDN71407.1 nitrite reductase (NO-forming) [Actinomyces ruminicola]